MATVDIIYDWMVDNLESDQELRLRITEEKQLQVTITDYSVAPFASTTHMVPLLDNIQAITYILDDVLDNLLASINRKVEAERRAHGAETDTNS